MALQAYKKGRYILASRPAQLLGLPVATTPQQQQQQKRIYDKVWGQVEKIIGDLRATLGKRLRDTKRGLDEVEKTIECVSPLAGCSGIADWSSLEQNSTRIGPLR